MTDPTVYDDISIYIESLRGIDSVGETPSGDVTFGLNALNVLTTIMHNPFSEASIEEATGITITDSNLNGIPDTKQQIATIFEYSRLKGVWDDGQNLILRPDQVQGAVYFRRNEEALTTIQFQMPGTRDQAVVAAALKEITPSVLKLENHRLS